jgi:hypothetical protein
VGAVVATTWITALVLGLALGFWARGAVGA